MNLNSIIIGVIIILFGFWISSKNISSWWILLLGVFFLFKGYKGNSPSKILKTKIDKDLPDRRLIILLIIVVILFVTLGLTLSAGYWDPIFKSL